jgi:bacteriocin biosynthesis cyclodehydratase domain-containing protein
MIYTLKKLTKIYTVKNNFYICYKNQTFETKDTKQNKKIETFFEALADGISKKELEDFMKNEELVQIYKFLSENSLLLTTEVEKESTKKHQELNEKLLNNHKTELNNFRIKIISENNDNFNKILSENLKKHGITKISINTDDNCDLLICIKTSNLNEKNTLKINKDNFSKNQSCLFVDLELGTHVAIGPLVIPKKTACYACYFERRLINQDYSTKHDYIGKKTIVNDKSSRIPLQESMISSLIVNEILFFFFKNNPRSLNKVIYFDTEEMELWEESLLRYPNCTTCN